MNFYTKVLSKLASDPDLSLKVTFEVPAEHEQADSKADETRTGLKELGLDDDVQVGNRSAYLSPATRPGYVDSHFQQGWTCPVSA